MTDFAASLLAAGFMEGVTMGHQLLVQLESTLLRLSVCVVAFIGYRLADSGRVGLRYRKSRARRAGEAAQ